MDEAELERDLVPGRRGRLRRQPERVRRSGPRTAATSAWSATTTSRCSARSTSRPSRPPPPPRCAGRARRSPTRRRRVPRRPRAAGERADQVALYHASPRDPSGSTCSGPTRPRECIGEQGRPGEPDRPLARGAVLRPPRRRHRRRCPRRPGRRRDQPRARARDGGCSTRAASASRATATRAPPGSSSTPTRWHAVLPPGGLRHRPRGRRDRRGRACPSTSRERLYVGPVSRRRASAQPVDGRPMSRLAAMRRRPRSPCSRASARWRSPAAARATTATIPSADSETMLALLTAIQASIAAGNCELAAKQAAGVQAHRGPASLPADDEVKAGSSTPPTT